MTRLHLCALGLCLQLLSCSSSDSGSEPGPAGECTFHDPASKLCWQDPPPAQAFRWQDAKAYCQSQGLRLPKIQELISLIRGCASSACILTDPGCTSSTCRSDPSCAACTKDSGPAANGCYWDAGLSGTCDWYWSSSGVDEGPYDAWYVHFQSAAADNGAHAIEKYVRCVRSEP
ncbi:MAG TPA: DUF1566 domain-containing protein [Polyangiaceae bacterium]|nr:DUF1566 domain-containing protein [Polyangiaceae bacterium]HMR78744.1 DUF1566 domain-containing protein [Polyangiaceae bacterium]